MSAARGRRLASVVAALGALGVLAPARLTAQRESVAARPGVALLERVAAAYRGPRALRARFTQHLVSAGGGAALRSEGEFLQQGPTRFAFRFTAPPEDRIVADGEAVWIYLPSTLRGQAFRLPRGIGAGAGLDLVSALLTDAGRRYVITELPDTSDGGRTWSRVALTPRAGAAPFTQAVLTIDPARAVIVAAVLTEPSGLVRTLAFTRVRLGGALPPDAFRFTPPAGVRVVDQAALLGGTPPR